jgi:D-inositol-3-phosphate glycosyltransferase
MPALEPTPRPDGRIDTPRPAATLDRGAILVQGWALFPDHVTVRVEVWLGEERLGLARLGLPRPDLRRQTGLTAAGVAGFELVADISEWTGADGDAAINVVAISTAGERFRLGPVPVTVAPTPKPEPKPKPKPIPARPAPRPSRRGCRRVLVYTHQLKLGGAQLYLLDLLRALIERDAIDPVVVSAMGGPLQEDLEDLDIPVHISSMIPIDDIDSHLGRVEELAVWAADGGFEVALINTATTPAFPGAEVAARLGIPVVWAIHESFDLEVLWAGLDRQVRQLAETALADAALLLFEAESTQQLYESVVDRDRCLTLPYGLDLRPIDAARHSFDRVAARRQSDIPADAEIVLCVGTVEPRKAQVSLAQAFDLIADRHPRARLFFVGGRYDDDSLMLAGCIESCRAASRIELIAITPEVQRWYGLADMLVCASDVESLPRTVLEAMAWEIPVLATNVYGLPELIDDGETGWLCESRDVEALAEGLDRALSSTTEERKRIAGAARVLVERRHSLDDYGREVGLLLDRVAIRARPVVDAAGP